MSRLCLFLDIGCLVVQNERLNFAILIILFVRTFRFVGRLGGFGSLGFLGLLGFQLAFGSTRVHASRRDLVRLLVRLLSS